MRECVTSASRFSFGIVHADGAGADGTGVDLKLQPTLDGDGQIAGQTSQQPQKKGEISAFTALFRNTGWVPLSMTVGRRTKHETQISFPKVKRREVSRTRKSQGLFVQIST